MEWITSRQNPLISQVRKLGADRLFRREQGLFLVEGVKLLEEAVRWGVEIATLIHAESCADFLEARAARVVGIPDALMNVISDVKTPQGVLAVCQMPTLTPPDKLTGNRYLILEGLQDPGNVGTIWRTADAFGMDGLFLTNHCADPWSPKTVRATMGACFRLPVWEVELEDLVTLLQRAEIPLRATALREDAADIQTFAWERAAVVIGSEGRGVSTVMLNLCAEIIKIPMCSRCESLNAAAAATVVLWEMYRQKNAAYAAEWFAKSCER